MQAAAYRAAISLQRCGCERWAAPMGETGARFRWSQGRPGGRCAATRLVGAPAWTDGPPSNPVRPSTLFLRRIR